MSRFFLLCFCLLLFPRLNIAQVCFKNNYSLNIGTSPFSICNGDFNNDGNIDIATANDGSASISVLLGNGLGSFSLFKEFKTISGGRPNSIICSDFNKDSNLDLAFTNKIIGFNSKLSVVFGDGSGNFLNEVNLIIQNSPVNLVAQDFNNDKNVDIAVLNASSGNISLFFGDGKNGFVPQKFLQITYLEPVNTIVSVDFNSDSILDLAVSHGANSTGSEGGIYFMMGDGIGGFSRPIDYLTDIRPFFLISNDFNNDFKQDLAAIMRDKTDKATVLVLLNDGKGVFSLKDTIALTNYSSHLISGDFNADGNIDLASSNNFYSTVTFLSGKGDGTFGDLAMFNSGKGTDAISSGDFNGDGKIDIVVGNQNSEDKITILTNSTPSINLNPIEKLIDINSQPILLNGTPNGGLFSGPGVVDNKFTPQSAGLGRKIILYTYSPSADCIVKSYLSTVVYDTVGNVCSVYDTLKIKINFSSGVNINKSNTVNIFPNPTHDILIIDYGDFNMMNGYWVTISDLTGRKVFSQTINTNKTELQINSILSRGIYILELLDPNLKLIQSKKIVIE